LTAESHILFFSNYFQI